MYRDEGIVSCSSWTDDVNETRDAKRTIHFGGWLVNGTKSGGYRAWSARLGQFDRFPVSGEPVSADGTLTPAVLRNRHTNTLTLHRVVYLGPRSRDSYREKNGRTPCLESW